MKCQTMSVKEAALYIGVSKDIIYELSRKKSIPHLRVGRRILFRKSVLDIWMYEQEKLSLNSGEIVNDTSIDKSLRMKQ